MGAIDDYKRRHAEQERRKKDVEAQVGFGKKTFRNPDRMIRFTWWVAAFTFCLAWVGAIQAWAFIQSERAFIAPASMSFIRPNPTEKIAVFNMKIANSGHSTANIKHHLYGITANLSDVPYYPDWPDITLSPVVGNGFIQFQIKFGPMTDNLMKFFSGDAPFFIYGRIDYEDEFTVFSYRKSGWCYRYDPKADPSVSQFTNCDNGKYTYSN